MSLSWEGKQPLAPRTGFDVYGRDIKLETDAPETEDEIRKHYEQIINSPQNFKHQEEDAAVHCVPPTVRQAVEEPATIKEKKKCWLLRPVAWLALLVSVYLMNSIVNTAFLLIAHVIDWLSTLPTMAVILLTLAFGSLVIGLLFTGALRLVCLVVTASHTIYPSRKGVRFYIVAAEQLVISLLAIIMTLTDPAAEHVFWDCMSAIYFAVVYIIMLCSVKSIIN